MTPFARAITKCSALSMTFPTFSIQSQTFSIQSRIIDHILPPSPSSSLGSKRALRPLPSKCESNYYWNTVQQCLSNASCVVVLGSNVENIFKTVSLYSIVKVMILHPMSMCYTWIPKKTQLWHCEPSSSSEICTKHFFGPLKDVSTFNLKGGTRGAACCNDALSHWQAASAAVHSSF